jgi:hypothetical protein
MSAALRNCPGVKLVIAFMIPAKGAKVGPQVNHDVLGRRENQ